MPPHQATTTSSSPQKLNVIIQRNKPKFQMATFYHGALCSPVISTLQKAIANNHLVSWPGISKINFKLNIVDTQAMDLGHLDQERKHLQSTKNPSSPENKPIIKIKDNNQRSFEILNSIIPFSAKSLTYGDLTGAFPYTSTRGAKYLYLMYDYDANAILVHPLKSRQGGEIKKAWEHLTSRLTKHGHVIKHFILDNECSNKLKKSIRLKNMQFQLVPPNNH